MNTGIYEIVNTANGKRYVGSAVNFGRRWKGHLRSCLNGSHHSRHLQRAWAKYGENAFEFRKLLICSKPNLLMYEQRAIDALKPEYNIAQRAGNTLGVKPTAEKIAKLSAANMGKRPSAEARAKMSAARLGKPHSLSPEGKARLIQAVKAMSRDYMRTPEYRAGAAELSRGRKYPNRIKVSVETRAKMSATRRAMVVAGWVNPMLGRQYSAEERAAISARFKGVQLKQEHAAKISAALKGKPRTAEHVEKLRAAIVARCKGVPLSQETRDKLSCALKGRPKSLEHRKKIAEANARRFAL